MADGRIEQGGYVPSSSGSAANPPKASGVAKGGAPAADGEGATTFAIGKLAVGPGDVVVLRSARVLSRETAAALRETLAEVFPANKVVVLDGGMTLEIVEPKTCGHSRTEYLPVPSPNLAQERCTLCGDYLGLVDLLARAEVEIERTAR